MSVEIEKYLGLLEKRLLLLQALAQQLVGCRKEFVAMDIDGMYSRISEQEELCRQIQSLHPAIDALQKTCAVHLGLDRHGLAGAPDRVASAERLRSVMWNIREAQMEVGRLNQIHAAYLRRCRRTTQVFMNFLENYAPTYARPTEPALAASQTTEKV